MPSRIPLARRQPGVSYALTPEGVELPVVDITHPLFALPMDPAAWARLREENRQHDEAWQRRPEWLQRLLFAAAKRRSVLLKGLAQGEDGFLSGLNTYLMKLSPEALDPSFSHPMDARLARSLPLLNVRVRLHHMAQLLAQALEPALGEPGKRPLRLLNLAGGPAMDSLNALILLRQRHGEALEGRETRIRVLDADSQGPAFGERALEALSEAEGPLHGLPVTFGARSYDWRHPEDLTPELQDLEGCIAAASSEGGLFEYGSDGEILENLHVLGQHTPADFTLSGSMHLADPAHSAPARRFTRLATRTFGPGDLEALAARASWRVDARLEGPSTICFRLAKRRD